MENIIEQIASSFQRFNSHELTENTKIDALNEANAILYAKKEQNVILDYRFGACLHDGVITITVFIKENESSDEQSWDLVICK